MPGDKNFLDPGKPRKTTKMLSVARCVLGSRSPSFESIPVLTSYATLGKMLHLSKPQFPHLCNKHHRVTIINSES